MTFFDSGAVGRALFGGAYDDSGIGNVMQATAARSSEPKIRSIAQGGGVVTSLIRTALEDGIIQAAVLTSSAHDGFPCGIVATDQDVTMSCSGSKFVGAHTLEALREALDRGFDRIGIVGLPCQVRAIRKMALLDLKGENLQQRLTLVIGLFCNWALSVRELLPFLHVKLNGHAVKRFDIPPPPANLLIAYTAENQAIEIPLDDVRQFIQKACTVCGDMTSEFADVSVGMYEGKPGWNTVLVRTPTGSNLVELSEKKGKIELEPYPDENLDHLKSAALKKRLRETDSHNRSERS
jgi:coenzyme F420 hydrogenase subunit beta